MPQVHVVEPTKSISEKLAFLQRICPVGLRIARMSQEPSPEGIFIIDPFEKENYGKIGRISHEMNRIDFWKNVAPAWLIAFARKMEGEFGIEVHIYIKREETPKLH